MATMYYERDCNLVLLDGKKVAVIGGGVGGMESALVLAQRGHQVTLYEKSDRLGGVFVQAAAPSYKEKDRALIQWYCREIHKQPNIAVQLNTPVESLDALQADAVIVATGATPKKPPIPGLEHALEATDFLAGAPVGDRVVILGGGLTGCEIAYELLLQGKHPTIVEMKNDLIAAKGVCLANSSYLREALALYQAPVHLNTTIQEIRPDGVTAKDQTGKTFDIPCDSVIVSVGYDPKPRFPASRKVHLVGDAKSVGNLRTVIWRAWDVCMKL